MDAFTDETAAVERELKKCVNCGNQDTDEFCSRCGSRLVFMGEEQSSTVQNFKTVTKEYVREVLDPIFAYLKTNWLLLRYPTKFFETLYFQDQPLSNLPFPLRSIWDKFNDGRTQYTLHPVAFFASNLVVNFITTVIFLAGFLGQRFLPDDPVGIPTIGAAGLSTLIYTLSSALVFDFLTREHNIAPHFKYAFWVYIFGLGWIGPLVGVVILVTFLLPFTLFFGCICLIAIGVVLALISPDSNETYRTIVNYLTTIAATINFLIASVGVIYIFFIIPWRVFSHLYQKKGIPANNLIFVILVSLLTPAVFLFMCIAPVYFSSLLR